MKQNKKVAQKVAEQTAEVSTTEVKTAPVIEKVNTGPKNLFGHMCRLIILAKRVHASIEWDDAKYLQEYVKFNSKFDKKHLAWYKWFVKNNPQKAHSKACLSN